MSSDFTKVLPPAHNRGLKIMAVVLAIVIWYTIRELTSFESIVRNIRMDIQVNEGLLVANRSSMDVDVLFRGSQGDIRNLNRDQIKVEIDLRSYQESGPVTVRLKPADVKSPGGARPIRVNPSDVTITLASKHRSNAAAVEALNGSRDDP